VGIVNESGKGFARKLKNSSEEILRHLEPFKERLGTLELWNFGTLELWNFGTLELWNFGTLELWNFGTLGA